MPGRDGSADTSDVAKKGNETAWMLDESIAVSSDGATIAGFPGVWRPGEAVHPETFGMTVSDFRELVERLSLPLVEVAVKEDSAAREFVRPDDSSRFGTAEMGTAIQAETDGGPDVADAELVDQTEIADPELALQRLDAVDDEEETS